MSGPRLYHTVGHSTRSVEELVALLHGAGVDLVADVRTIPRSRTNPQFNADTLPGALAAHGVGYRHIRKLGGLRGRPKVASPSPNAFWDNPGFRNYADYAMTPDFSEGLAELRELAREHACAVICAEAVWWRCHRRIVADYLIAAGEPVLHILGPGHIEPAAMHPAARPQPDGGLVLPPRMTALRRAPRPWVTRPRASLRTVSARGAYPAAAGITDSS